MNSYLWLFSKKAAEIKILENPTLENVHGGAFFGHCSVIKPPNVTKTELYHWGFPELSF